MKKFLKPFSKVLLLNITIPIIIFIGCYMYLKMQNINSLKHIEKQKNPIRTMTATELANALNVSYSTIHVPLNESGYEHGVKLTFYSLLRRRAYPVKDTRNIKLVKNTKLFSINVRKGSSYVKNNQAIIIRKKVPNNKNRFRLVLFGSHRTFEHSKKIIFDAFTAVNSLIMPTPKNNPIFSAKTGDACDMGMNRLFRMHGSLPEDFIFKGNIGTFKARMLLEIHYTAEPLTESDLKSKQSDKHFTSKLD